MIIAYVKAQWGGGFLFTAVFERDVLEAIGELLRALRQDPEVGLCTASHVRTSWRS
jgi:hypothetical protein